MKNKILCGIDIGTNSVGWCVTDETYKIIKKGGKSLWGVRLFDEAKSASERRKNRTNRRRLSRRNQRIKLLKSLFETPMKEIDSSFFYRLDNSSIHNEDREEKFDYTLFNSLDFKDSDYFKEYPTIYHLRKFLLTTEEKVDLRFIYLAFHHMIKYRGHFLNEGEEYNGTKGDELLKEFEKLNSELHNLNNEEEKFEKLLINEEIVDNLKKNYKEIKGIRNLKEKFNSILNPNLDKFLTNIIIPLICGSDVNIKNIKSITKEEFEIIEQSLDKKNITISVKSESFDDDVELLKSLLPDYEKIFNLFIYCKIIYQSLLLDKLLGDNQYLSFAMVEQYEKHNNELKALKDYVKKNHKDDYDRLFRIPKISNEDKKTEEVNYSSYVGSYNVNGEKKRFNHGDKKAFYNLVKKILKIDKYKSSQEIDDQYLKSVYEEITNDSYLSFINSTDNGVFPYQLNKIEMEEIIRKQSKYYSFFNEVDNEGYSTKNKILSLLTFKIPYYIGPLAKPSNNNHSWIVRKEEGQIFPWNFNQKVDLEESAKVFIQRMVSKCTYLHKYNCLPVNSIIFSYYNVLSFLNKIHINGTPIDYDTKIDLIKEVFLTNRKVTIKNIENYLRLKDKNIKISTSNDKSISNIVCNMASYIDFVKIFGKEYVIKNIKQLERIINDIVVFEDKKVLEKRLKLEYNLKDEEIKKIKGLNYKNYGRLSKELLMDLVSIDENGEAQGSILSIMQNSNQNLMEIINDEKYNFQELIDECNKTNNNELTPLEYINDLFVSPGMKRALIQTYKIIEEIEKIIERPIDEFYVECTRTNKAKKLPSKTRYDRLKELYDNAKSILKDDVDFKRMYDKLNNLEDNNINKFQSDKYYLYFTQMGKCLYSGNSIDIESISYNKKYDIDHIIPQSLIKDDSLNNRVLVEYNMNRKKSDTYPISQDILWGGNYKKAYEFYKKLLDAKLISEEKYNRLTKRQLLESELDSFVNRQLVYTNQAVKGLIEIIKQFKVTENHSPKIVYSKSENVSDFRKRFNLPKSRTANNYHHAHDAYLNIVVGSVIDKHFMPFTNNHTSLLAMHSQNLTTNADKIFEGDIRKDRFGNEYWNKNEYIKMINHYLYETFDILTTTRTYYGNELFKKITILPAGIGNIPLKTNGPLKSVDKYGGLKEYGFGSYALIKVKDEYILESIPTVYKNNVSQYLDNIYKNYEIEIEKLKINTACISNGKKFCITGKTKNSYYLQNLLERNFSKDEIRLIHLIDKTIAKLSKITITGKETDDDINNLGFIYLNNELIISPAQNEKVKVLKIKDDELLNFYNNYILMLKKNIYSFSPSIKIAEYLENNRGKFIDMSIIGKIKLLSNLLDYLKCNERKTIDLTLIGGDKVVGNIRINKKLKDCKIIAESITGFYTKVLKEI